MTPMTKTRTRIIGLRALLQGPRHRRGRRAPCFRACSMCRWRRPAPRVVEPAGERHRALARAATSTSLMAAARSPCSAPLRLLPARRSARSPVVSAPMRRMEIADFRARHHAVEDRGLGRGRRRSGARLRESLCRLLGERGLGRDAGFGVRGERAEIAKIGNERLERGKLGGVGTPGGNRVAQIGEGDGRGSGFGACRRAVDGGGKLGKVRLRAWQSSGRAW